MGLNDCEFVKETGRGNCERQHMDLDRQSSYLRCPSSNSNQLLCSSAELSWRCTLTRELGRVQSCLIQNLRQGVLPALESGLPIPRQVAKSQPHPCGECLLAPPDQRTGYNSWKLCSPAQPCSSQEVGRQSGSPPQSQYQSWRLPMGSTGRGIHS